MDTTIQEEVIMQGDSLNEQVPVDEDEGKAGKDELFRKMLEIGVQYGRAKRFTNPAMREFLLKSNKTVELFDMEKTLGRLDQMVAYLQTAASENKTILFVAVQPAAQETIENTAHILNQPYLSTKWVGGFLTNFGTIKVRMKFYLELKQKKEKGEIDNYPTHEKIRTLRELQKMEMIYKGVAQMESLPDIIFTVNLNHKPHRTMLREAKRKHIPIIGICGSDNDPANFNLFIPANDKAPRSIKWIIDYLITQIGAKDTTNIHKDDEDANTADTNTMDTSLPPIT